VGVYDGARALAKRLIKEKGRAVTLRRNDQGAALVDAGKPWLGRTQTPQDAATYAVFGAVQVADLLSRLGGGGDLAATKGLDTVVLVAALDLAFEPDPGTRVVDGARTWEVTAVDVVKPGADPIYYALGLRK